MTSAAAVLYIGDKQKSLLSSSKGLINTHFSWLTWMGESGGWYGRAEVNITISVLFHLLDTRFTGVYCI